MRSSKEIDVQPFHRAKPWPAPAGHVELRLVQAAKYPNGRVFTDDVIHYRLDFLTKGEVPSPGLSPHTDTLAEFPYLGTPHQP
ncbi:MAG: hypothetical protein WBW75_04070 [Mycobacterium sp.]|uniref:hypothetical protein n=1 Tax=Mycobacterium sp. TaxID=1785 RepID=UPI003C583E8A